MFGLALIGILAFAAFPLLSAATAYGIANVLGCPLNEAGAQPCPLFGVDLGQALVAMTVAGWFGLATVPVGAVLLLIWVGVLIFVWATYLRERRQSRRAQ